MGEQLTTTQGSFLPTQGPEQWGLQTSLQGQAEHSRRQQETTEQARRARGVADSNILYIPTESGLLFVLSRSIVLMTTCLLIEASELY